MKKSKGVKHEIKKVAMDLKEIYFPRCANICKAIEWFGASEYENICPFKFRKNKKHE